MADVIVVTPAKKAKVTKFKKSKTAPSHPKVSDMVNEAISTLKERGGSSLVAIKKYIASNFKVDVEKLSPFIKKYLKSSVVSGGLVQTKGKGATGSFRIGGGAVAVNKVRSAAKIKKASTATKKASKPQKVKVTATPKKLAKPKKAASPKKPKSSPAKAAKKPAAKKAATVKKSKVVKVKKPNARSKKASKKGNK